MPFACQYSVSPAHWSVILFDPRAPRADDPGTRDVTFVGRTAGFNATDVYRANGGRWRRVIVQNFKDGKNHLLAPHTPRMALESNELTGFVRPRRKSKCDSGSDRVPSRRAHDGPGCGGLRQDRQCTPRSA